MNLNKLAAKASMLRTAGKLLIMLLTLAGCSQTLAPIEKEADASGPSNDYRKFAKYVPAAYPIGSDAQKLESILRSQGFFIINNPEDEFLAEDAVWYCGGGYFVRWSVDHGLISRISAQERRCAGP